MACAEAEQLAAVATALQQRDTASIAALMRAALSVAVVRGWLLRSF